MSNFKCEYQSILKGVPQGSIPVLFHMFINVIFHFIKNCKLYNYADDNTVSHADKNLKRLIVDLVGDSLRLIRDIEFRIRELIQWFAVEPS